MDDLNSQLSRGADGEEIAIPSLINETPSRGSLAETQSLRKKTTPMPSWQKYLRELIALALWISVLSKLFVFDVDRWFIDEYFPSAAWILDYRFAFVVAFIGLVAIFWNKQLLWRWIGYLIVYPLVVIVWHIPAFWVKFVIKRRSWTLGVALVALGVSAVRNFRVNVLLASGLMLGTIICSFARSSLTLAFGSMFLVASLLFMYWQTVTAAFQQPLDSFSRRALDALWRLIQKAFDTQEITNVPFEEMSEEQRKTWTTNWTCKEFCVNGFSVFIEQSFCLRK